jgi:hypothetical protein
MACGSATERGRAAGRTVAAVPTRLEGWSPEICGELFTGKGNEEKAGLLAGTGPCDLGGLYAPKGGTLRCRGGLGRGKFIFG